jgi:hypothetical protein
MTVPNNTFYTDCIIIVLLKSSKDVKKKRICKKEEGDRQMAFGFNHYQKDSLDCLERYCSSERISHYMGSSYSPCLCVSNNPS